MASSSVLLAALVACVLVLSAEAVYRRQVSCSGTSKIIPDGALSLYSVGFVNETVNFDALLIFSGVSGGEVDFGEMLNTINGIKGTLNHNYTWTNAQVAALWNETWVNLAAVVEAEAMEYLSDGDNVSAQSALHRASMYYQLSGRYLPLTDPSSLAFYRRSVQLFEQAVTLPSGSPRFPLCTPLQIPFGGSSMHAYWCHTTVARADGKRPAILTVNGYDGTAEIQYYTVARSMLERGYSVLVVEGPGQGSTARFNNLTFMPNYEVPVTAALNFLLAQYANVIDPELVYLWGESFGGYLAPRAFAYEPRFKALVSNGGVYDFYQVLICDLPPVLQELYYSNQTAEFDAYIARGLPYSTGLTFLVNYGHLGFGANNMSALLDQLTAYTMSGSMQLLANRSLFVYDPAWDTLVGNQSQIFASHLPPTADATVVQLDPYRGTGMHCAVGSTANINIAIARWIERHL